MTKHWGTGVRVPAAVVRLGARQLGSRVLNPSLPWDVQRTRLERLTRPTLLPKGTKVIDTALNGVPAEVVTVGEANPGRTVVHFHGGGYCIGSAITLRTWAAHLSARAACRLVLPEYRL